jgi:hypothetical protein
MNALGHVSHLPSRAKLGRVACKDPYLVILSGTIPFAREWDGGVEGPLASRRLSAFANQNDMSKSDDGAGRDPSTPRLLRFAKQSQDDNNLNNNDLEATSYFAAAPASTSANENASETLGYSFPATST